MTRSIRSWVRDHPRVATVVISVVGYAVVLGSFTDLVTVPQLTDELVNRFSDLIAVVNTVALTTLLAGYGFIKRGDVTRHRRAMLTTFALILLFLVLYIWKQAGGFTKGLVVENGQFLAQFAGAVEIAYLVMLAVHILLSVVAVPFVLHAIILGLTQPVDELPQTLHPTVGKIAIAAWSTSLFLGIVTYLMLNHVYSWEKIEAAVVPVLLFARPISSTISE